jgi:Cys-tRNA(Pro)/Cys-tRNA(Cys) deacylase
MNMDFKRKLSIPKEIKELFPLTGYVRGGCSPIGMKKKYKTFFDEMILLLDEIYVSAGQRGMQLKLDPQDLIDLTEAKVGELT